MMQVQLIPENSTKDTLISLDLSKDYPKTKLILQDIAKIDYIPLETRSDALVSGVSYYGIYDSIIIFSDYMSGEFLVFNKNGKIKNHFSNKGGSGEEYMSCLEFMYDEKAHFHLVLFCNQPELPDLFHSFLYKNPSLHIVS